MAVRTTESFVLHSASPEPGKRRSRERRAKRVVHRVRVRCGDGPLICRRSWTSNQWSATPSSQWTRTVVHLQTQLCSSTVLLQHRARADYVHARLSPALLLRVATCYPSRPRPHCRTVQVHRGHMTPLDRRANAAAGQRSPAYSSEVPVRWTCSFHARRIAAFQRDHRCRPALWLVGQ